MKSKIQSPYCDLQAWQRLPTPHRAASPPGCLLHLDSSEQAEVASWCPKMPVHSVALVLGGATPSDP